MKYHYIPIATEFGVFSMPFVDVVFSNPDDSTKHEEVFSLVDSGSATILLRADFAEPLRIDLEAGEEVEIYGIRHSSDVAYKHTVRMRLKFETQDFLVPCYFMPELHPSALLGQQELFEHHSACATAADRALAGGRHEERNRACEGDRLFPQCLQNPATWRASALPPLEKLLRHMLQCVFSLRCGRPVIEIFPPRCSRDEERA